MTKGAAVKKVLPSLESREFWLYRLNFFAVRVQKPARVKDNRRVETISSE
jgi:hypothetical protein